MSTKSHRQKVLQAMLEEGPSTSAGQLVAPASVVTSSESKKSSKKSRKSKTASSSVLGSSLKSSKGKQKEDERDVQDDDEEEQDNSRAGGAENQGDAEMEVEGWDNGPANDAAGGDDDDADMLIDGSGAVSEAQRIMQADTSKPTPVRPSQPVTRGSSATASSPFAPLTGSAAAMGVIRAEQRRVAIPPHRMTPLKKEWVNIYGPLVEMMGLMVRMNVQRKSVELKTSKHTVDNGAIQKGADFVKAFALGFDVKDAIAILRLEDLYLDSFEVKDVKTLHGDHLSRAIGRIAGQDGKTKFTIENASRTRIVLADTYVYNLLGCCNGTNELAFYGYRRHIHILGSVQNIKIARDAIVSLILGSPPGKVYAHLRSVGARLKQRF